MAIRRIIAGAVFAALLGAAVPASAQAVSALEQAKLARAAELKYAVQSAQCRWGSPVIALAMFHEKSMWRSLAALEDKAAADAIFVPTPDAQPCGSPADSQAQGEAAVIFWRWATRSAILAQYSAQPGWTNGLIDLAAGPINDIEPRRNAIGESLSQNAGAAALQSEQAILVNEARLVLSLVCEERKTVRSAAPRACPEVSAEHIAQRPIAKIRAQDAESFNRMLADAILKEQRGEFGMPYQFNPDEYDFSSNCKAGYYTIYPEAPTTKVEGESLDVSVVAFGQAGEIARAKVIDDGVSFEIVSMEGRVVFWRDPLAVVPPSFKFCTTMF